MTLPDSGENRVEFGCRVIVDHEDGLIVKSSHFGLECELGVFLTGEEGEQAKCDKRWM